MKKEREIDNINKQELLSYYDTVDVSEVHSVNVH